MAKRGKRGLQIDKLIRDTASPVFFVNADREIAFVNASCETLLGRPADQLVGLFCRYHGATGTADLPDLAACLAPPPEVMNGLPGSIQTIIIRSDGERLSRQIHFFPYSDSTRTVLMVMGVIAEDSQLVETESLNANLHEQLLRLRSRLYDRFRLDRLIGTGDAMARVLDQVRVAARSDANVMIWGELGTGKEMVARIIHAESGRKSAPFIPVDCALLPPNPTERDLLVSGRSSWYGPSSGSAAPLRSFAGTLFLKNVSSLARDTQLGLLDLLQSPSSPGNGPGNKSSTAVRLVGTDVSSPNRLIHDHVIRPDLFYQLTTIVIELPALRDRKEDIPLLAQMFLERNNADGKKQVSGLAANAIEVLLTYDWPGNARELAEVITEAHAACSSNVITAEHLAPRIQGAQGGAFVGVAEGPLDLDATLAETERGLIEQAIKRARGNKSVAADLLAITRPRLYRRMQLLGMDELNDGSRDAADAGPNASG